MTEQELRDRKRTLEEELGKVDGQLAHIDRMKKPWEAVVHHWCCNRSSTFWKTEAQARKKMEEYYAKRMYLNGRVDRVQLLRYTEDGAVNVVEDRQKNR